jgi:HPr kinase/phosphorylase
LKKLVAYITTGYPDPEFTVDLALSLAEAGVDTLELGIPFSDPVADGPVIEAANLFALQKGFKMADLLEVTRTGPDAVHGHCPPLLADFIEVRGLGILNVRAMYGNHAVLEHKRLHLIIDLQPADIAAPDPDDRIGRAGRERQILGVAIPEVRLALAPGRDLSVLIEAAVRNHVLRLSGYNAAEDLAQRQRQAMEPREP